MLLTSIKYIALYIYYCLRQLIILEIILSISNYVIVYLFKFERKINFDFEIE